MAGMDPERAARDLAEADQRLRRGAELTTPPRWSRLVGIVGVVVLAARWDVPASAQRWYAVFPLAVAAALAVSVIFERTRPRARPLALPVGWRARVWFAVLLVVAGVALVGGGLGLRAVGVPLPFTLSSVLTLGAVWLLNWCYERFGGGYVQRVRRGQW